MGLDTVETILWAEQEFGITIPDADASAVETVGEFSAYIHRQLIRRDGLKAATEAQVYDAIKEFLVSNFGMKPEWIKREAKFISDLGMQ